MPVDVFSMCCARVYLAVRGTGMALIKHRIHGLSDDSFWKFKQNICELKMLLYL